MDKAIERLALFDTWKVFVIVFFGFMFFIVTNISYFASFLLLFSWYFLCAVVASGGIFELKKYIYFLFLASLMYPLILDINLYLGYESDLVFRFAHNISFVCLVLMLLSVAYLIWKLGSEKKSIIKFFLYFLSLWLFPVGIWVVHPIIKNRIIELKK